ncbi:hypothetical protein EPN87_03525 [archaeon]|nr:MAG: hypothetical protein EPN87_03525 [archaeon]
MRKLFVATFMLVILLSMGVVFAASLFPFTYGDRPIGSTERVVYQQPMVMQDLNGTISAVMVSIIVWKG